MATASEIQRLTESHRSSQAREAAIVAALVAAYLRSKVDLQNPASIERWIELMVPRILSGSTKSARLAASYANTLRQLEVPGAPAYQYAPTMGSLSEQVERSLRYTGPVQHSKALEKIAQLDVSPTTEKALVRQATNDTLTRVSGAAVRHTMSGGRSTLQRGHEGDRVALGYLRVTRAKPCYFCAMLASRGVDYKEESFRQSDARFAAGLVEGDAKVHDWCQCSLKPYYGTDEDPYLVRALEFERQWYDLSGGEDDALTNFRRGYEGRTKPVKRTS